jgi:glycosyltransferase involved in cell wall biosynthesis
MARLSVLIPVYNERPTIETLIGRVQAAPLSIEKEILVGDDGSRDGTREILDRLRGQAGLSIEFMPENVGRGGVLKYLWQRATGDLVIHQDADLEYDPSEYQRLIDPILTGEADVVYGSRFRGSVKGMRLANSLGNHVLTLACRLLYGVRITDLMTCYKVYRRSLVENLQIAADGFDFEAELTARLAQRGARFAEVPISFVARTFEEGKKIRAVDAVHVTRRLLSCRITPLPHAARS